MSTKNYGAIMRKCDELTENGATLSVTWNGGGDQGAYELRINDKIIENDYGHPNSILDLFEDELQHGGFDGSYSVNGEALYNREEKNFHGTETNSMSDSDTADCKIKVIIPDTLWFDKLDVRVELTVYDRIEPPFDQTITQLIVFNGPVTDEHKALESKITQQITCQLAGLLHTLENAESVNERFTMDRADFIQVGNDLISTIEEFSYSYNDYTEKEVHIDLVQKNDEHEPV